MLNMCNWNMLNMYKPMRNTQMTCMIGPLAGVVLGQMGMSREDTGS